jgi:hypothetical protein
MQRGGGTLRSRISASAPGPRDLPFLSSGSIVPISRIASSCAHAVVVVSASAIVMSAFFAPSVARADVDFQTSVTAGAAWMPSLPALKSASTMTAAREVPESSVKTGGALVSAGGGLDLAAVVDDHYVIPALGFAAYGAVGSYPTIVTSADGSIARASPWTTYQVDALLPGIGYRMKRRRFMFGASIRTGFSWMHMSGAIAGGTEDTLVSLSGTSLLVQVELEACRRLDPVTRVCLQVAPRIYDFGFMNGATLGLRVEWGR